jgi:NDP-sugar pyrophosphorylase family protein
MKNLNPANFFDLSNFKHAKIFDDCNYVWDAITKISEYLSSYKNFKIEVDVPDNAYLIDKESISIGKGTIIEPGAYIKGPCIIGDNCVVRHGAYIRGDFIAGDSCVIGHDTEVKSTIMLNYAHAAHFAYLGNSILGNNVNLGAGTKCANLKLDGEKINLLCDGLLIATGLRKLGSIIGDGCQLGCNSVTNPGTILEKNVFCYPCTNFGGFIPENSLVQPDTKVIIKKRRI